MTGNLNDLWRYRVNDSTWTWISGSNTINQRASYGEKGVPSPSNVPGARYGAAGWFDNDRQELWLFGGTGVDEKYSGTYFSDTGKPANT